MPILTRAQVLAGLRRKIRFAQEFVPVIESCEVLSDEGGVVDRVVKFKEGQAPRTTARETVRCWSDAWVSVILGPPDQFTHSPPMREASFLHEK